MIPRPASRQQMFRRTTFAFGTVLVLLTFFLVQLTIKEEDSSDEDKSVTLDSLQRDQDNKDSELLHFQDDPDDELDEELEEHFLSNVKSFTELKTSKVQAEIIWYNLIEENNGIGSQLDERFECDLGKQQIYNFISGIP